MHISFVLILAASALLTWWLSGFDAGITGEDRAADQTRRILRCGVTLVLVGIGQFSGIIFFAMAVPIAVIWAGCVSELFSRSFRQLVDSPDPAPFDPDRLAGLDRSGRYEETIRLCTQLAESGDASALGMDAMLAGLYGEISTDAHFARSPRLAEGLSLSNAGQYHDAESRLVELLRQEPANMSATLLSLRIYTRAPGESGRAITPPIREIRPIRAIRVKRTPLRAARPTFHAPRIAPTLMQGRIASKLLNFNNNICLLK